MADHLLDYLTYFTVSLRAEGKAPRTVSTYATAVEQFARYLDDRDLATDLGAIDRHTLQGYVAHLVETRSPATALQRHSSLRQFFSWAVEEELIASSPMDGIKRPKVPDKPVPVYTDDEIAALLKACEGQGFAERRDQALLRLLLDSGARLSEIANLKVPDLDLDRQQFTCVAKGGHILVKPFGNKTTQALTRYLMRARRTHRHQALPWLWLGPKGQLGASGIRQVIERRGEQAGVAGAHAHRFRHTYADRWLRDGGSEVDLVRLMGWKSPEMVYRYGASAASSRAEADYRRRAIGDRY
jgi:site-specific recombinase XerD